MKNNSNILRKVNHKTFYINTTTLYMLVSITISCIGLSIMPTCALIAFFCILLKYFIPNMRLHRKYDNCRHYKNPQIVIKVTAFALVFSAIAAYIINSTIFRSHIHGWHEYILCGVILGVVIQTALYSISKLTYKDKNLVSMY